MPSIKVTTKQCVRDVSTKYSKALGRLSTIFQLPGKEIIGVFRVGPSIRWIFFSIVRRLISSRLPFSSRLIASHLLSHQAFKERDATKGIIHLFVTQFTYPNPAPTGIMRLKQANNIERTRPLNMSEIIAGATVETAPSPTPT